MNKVFSFLFLALISCNSFSQKTIEKEIDASFLNGIELNSNKVHSIKLISELTNTIKIKTRVEGEHHENVVMSMIEKDNKLFIKPEYSPFFEAENDKLAAHKIQSIEIELVVPERFLITIKSKIAAVTSKGSFNAIFASLEIGNCTLQEFKGDAYLLTTSGSIIVSTKTKIFGEAISKSGSITNELSSNTSKYQIKAETKEGNISLFQIH